MMNPCCCVPPTPCTTFTDYFNRANSSSLGSDWSEDSGSWAILGNILRCTAAGRIRTVPFVGDATYNSMKFKVTASSGDVIRFGWKYDGISGPPSIGRHWEIKFGSSGYLKFNESDLTNIWGCDYSFPAAVQVSIEIREWALFVDDVCVWNGDWDRLSSPNKFQITTVTVTSAIDFDDIELFELYYPYNIGSDGIDTGPSGDSDCLPCLPCHWFTQEAADLPNTIDLEFDANWLDNDAGTQLYSNLVGNYTLNQVPDTDDFYPCRWELTGLNINIGAGTLTARTVIGISFIPYNESGYLYGGYDKPKHMVSLLVRQDYGGGTTEDRWDNDIIFGFIANTNYNNYTVGSACDNHIMVVDGLSLVTFSGGILQNIKGDVIVTKT